MEYRSTNQECRSTNQEYRSTNQDRSAMSLITGLKQFYNYMSSVPYYLIIGAFLATLFVHDILYFTFMVTCQFVFILHIMFMFHEHNYAFCISYIFHVTIHMAFHILVQYNAYVFTHHSCILVPLWFYFT